MLLRGKMLQQGFARQFAAVDAIGDAHASVSVARQGQTGMKFHAAFDLCHSIQMPQVILRHGTVPTGDSREIRLAR